MNTIEIFTDHFLPNPWQPREQIDPEDVKKLALSIAKDGLMQAPEGRWVFPDGTPARGMGSADLTGSGLRVQLAYGHSRLEAFRWLEVVKSHSNLFGDWRKMPVVIRELTDEEMARRGVSENLARKDLNAIEEAHAMRRFRDEFGKTSGEIGEIFGLAESTVRNKIRLLNLPEALQQDLRRGLISEGTGRALLPLYDLPEAARSAAEDGEGLRPSVILEAARSGVAPARVAEMVSALAGRLVPAVGQISVFDLEASVSTETLEAVEAADPRQDADPLQGAEAAAATVEDAPAWMEEEEEPELEEEGESGEEAEEVPNPRVVEPEPMPVREAMRAVTPERVMEIAREVKAVQAQAAVPAVKAAPAQPQVPAPTPAAEPEKPVTWEGSTVLLSLTLWPEDSHGGRMVSIGGRLNQGSPRMAMASLADLNLPWQLHEMLESLKGGLK
jgi:ParB family chromosome partitioning protein